MRTCPRCEQPLYTVDYEGVEIDACRQCGGEWLDAGELRQLIEVSEPGGEAEVAAARRARMPGVVLDRVRENLLCPVCRRPMTAFNYGGDSGIILDKCEQCGGIWLDAGELHKVLLTVAASGDDLKQDLARFAPQLQHVEDQEEVLADEDARHTYRAGASTLINRILDL